MAVHGFVSAGGTDGRRASVAWERAREAVDKAQALELEENWTEAYDLYARFFMPSLVRDLPDDPLQQALALGVARTLLRLGRPDEAFRSLDALAGSSVRLREATLLAVKASLERGDSGQAERIAFAATAGRRDDGELLGLLLRAQLAIGQDEAALETVRRLMAVEGPAPKTLMTLSELLVRTAAGRPETERPEALRRLGEAVARLDDEDLREAEPEKTLMTASRALAAAERWEEALAGFDAAPDAEGDSARARAELLARILVESGRYGECVSRAQGWLALWPSSVTLRRLAAQALALALAEGPPDPGGEESGKAARRALESGLRDTPEPGILLALARSFEWAGDRRKALDLLEGGRATFAGDFRVRMALARALEREGQLSRAVAVAEEAAAAGPYRPEAWKTLAGIRDALGQKDEAATASGRAADVERDLAAAWHDGAAAAGEAANPPAGR
jgi:tetratricopeptide (TPR) repeat protein